MATTFDLPSGEKVTRSRAANGFRYELHTTQGPPVVLTLADVRYLAGIALEIAPITDNAAALTARPGPTFDPIDGLCRTCVNRTTSMRDGDVDRATGLCRPCWRAFGPRSAR